MLRPVCWSSAAVRRTEGEATGADVVMVWGQEAVAGETGGGRVLAGGESHGGIV